MDNKNNSGNWNSGNCNSGNWNSGNWNSGNCNSGNCNSGNCNSGNWNSGNWNSGMFNTDEPFVRAFNKDTNLKRSEIDFPSMANYQLTEWVSIEEATKKEKAEIKDVEKVGGFLRRYTYKEMWANGWAKDAEENKQKFLNLPNFDADIFLEITGIDVRKELKTCEGKEIEINGVKYVLTRK